MFSNARQPTQSEEMSKGTRDSLPTGEDERVMPSPFESLKASFSVVLVALSSFGGGVDTNSNHSCSGCPTCLPPPRVEVIKKREGQDSEEE